MLTALLRQRPWVHNFRLALDVSAVSSRAAPKYAIMSIREHKLHVETCTTTTDKAVYLRLRVGHILVCIAFNVLHQAYLTFIKHTSYSEANSGSNVDLRGV